MLLTSSKGFISSKFLKKVVGPTLLRAISGTNVLQQPLIAICDKVVTIWDSVSKSVTNFGGGLDQLKVMKE